MGEENGVYSTRYHEDGEVGDGGVGRHIVPVDVNRSRGSTCAKHSGGGQSDFRQPKECVYLVYLTSVVEVTRRYQSAYAQGKQASYVADGRRVLVLPHDGSGPFLPLRQTWRPVPSASRFGIRILLLPYQ